MTIIYNKKTVLELDVLNSIIVNPTASVTLDNGATTFPTFNIASEFMGRFLESLDSFWHTENDQLQALSFYADGTLYCQRRKLKYDFASGQKVYSTYVYTGYTNDQIAELKQKVESFFGAVHVIKELKINKYVEKIDKEYLFFEKTYLKRRREKNDILIATDWRVLPDVADTYEGEKDLWIEYRRTIRGLLLKSPTEFESGLAFFKYISTMKWPVDPKNYREMYPDGLSKEGTPVAYLSTDDQWVERETDSSRDLIESRLQNIISLRQNYLTSERKTTKLVKDIMKELRLEDFVEGGVDYTKIYTEEDINELTE